jgi:hypothetical protein
MYDTIFLKRIFFKFPFLPPKTLESDLQQQAFRIQISSNLNITIFHTIKSCKTLTPPLSYNEYKASKEVFYNGKNGRNPRMDIHVRVPDPR